MKTRSSKVSWKNVDEATENIKLFWQVMTVCIYVYISTIQSEKILGLGLGLGFPGGASGGICLSMQTTQERQV